ncbi:MAG: NAD(P)/FAD-dependent oxidoreductase [Desulfobaccales bacterium]
MADDLLDKGAILQRDKQNFAIAPHIPGGIITDVNLLRKLADVAEKYHVQSIKITSAQRIALIGFRQEDLDNIWAELDMVPGAAIGLCVRSVKICPGTDYCRIGMQDAVGVGLKLDDKYHGVELPFKFKMGVSGCPNNCAESSIKDIGLTGMAKGWRVLAGGYVSGLKPRLADVIATGLNDEEALSLVDKIIDWYRDQGKAKRLGRVIDDVGLARFMEDLGLPVQE